VDTAIIRQGELVGRGLMAYETTEEMGSVMHVLVDVPQAQVVGFAYKAPGLMGRQQVADWEQLVKIGGDRILIHQPTSTEPSLPLSAAQNMTQLEVWTDGGDLIGHIVDLCFDRSSGKIEQYLFALKHSPSEAQSTESLDKEISADLSEDELADLESIGSEKKESPVLTEVFTILPEAIISAGRKRVMIAEEDAQRSQPYPQKLDLTPKESITLKPDWRPEQLPTIPTDFNELLQKGQSLAGQVGERVKQQAKKFNDEQLAGREFGEAGTLPDIAEQLQEKSTQVKAQLQKAREQAAERAKEQLEKSRLEERFEETIGKTPFGRKLGKQLDRFRKPQANTDPIDVESFEVWEDD